MNLSNADNEVKEIIAELQEKINESSFKSEGFDIEAIDYWLFPRKNILEYGQEFVDYWALRLGQLFAEKLTVQCGDFVVNANWAKFDGCERYYIDANGLLIDPKALLITEASSNIQVKEGTFDSIFFNFIYVYKYSLYPFINPIIDMSSTSEDSYLLRWGKLPPQNIYNLVSELEEKGYEWQRHLTLDTYDCFFKDNWTEIYLHLQKLL